ncbi:MAG: hypothetical protein EON58_08505 [Alphaproteobacteria bacterium]|nr:MAG: hypothetical protein EON58_08505 [Alphaproteobacteria bacterium]
MYKLTRIRVDIPNSFDGLWALDIKKSAAHPPAVIRERLKQLIPHFADKSRKTVVYPGRKTRQEAITPLWNKIEPRHGTFAYHVNTGHPLVSRISESLGGEDLQSLQLLLDYLGASLPFQSIYADMCSDRPGNAGADVEDLTETARTLIRMTGKSIDEVLRIDPLARHATMHNSIRERLENV